VGCLPTTARDGSRTGGVVWLALLAVSILINYVDRGNIAVAAPLLKDELRISATQIGVLITAFFWTYTVVLAISGSIVDRFDVNLVLAAGFALWSVATALTGVVHGFAMLVMLRMFLGMGESVAFPACSKIIALNVPGRHRGVANALLITGMGLGPAVGTYACGISMAHWGWRPVFIFIGVASLLWLVPWLRYMPPNASSDTRQAASIPALEIIRQRSFWAVSAGHFCAGYPLYFIIVWLPLYLVRERHQSMQQMSREAAMFYVVFAAFAPLSGWAADQLIRRGGDVTLVRKGCVGVGWSLMTAGVLGCGAADARLSFGGLMLLAAGCGFVAPNVYVFAQLLAGPAVAGKWTGLQSCIGNLAGVAVGPITGSIVDRTGRFGSAFVICAAMSALGAVCWLLLVGRLEPIAWRTTEDKVRLASEMA
jgi:MFS transporter, ACS family, D-galactonate transporter